VPRWVVAVTRKVVGFYTEKRGSRRKVRPVTAKTQTRKVVVKTNPKKYWDIDKQTERQVRFHLDKTRDMPGRKLPQRMYWLLATMCARKGVDPAIIDPTLDYWENKQLIEEQARVKLALSTSGEAKRFEEEMKWLDEKYEWQREQYERERERQSHREYDEKLAERYRYENPYDYGYYY